MACEERHTEFAMLIYVILRHHNRMGLINAQDTLLIHHCVERPVRSLFLTEGEVTVICNSNSRPSILLLRRPRSRLVSIYV